MKRKLLSVAIASAITSGPALAFDPTLTAPEYTIVVSGATAPQDTLNNVISFNLCDSDIDRFNNGTHWGVACVVKNIGTSVTGLPAAGRKILFLKNNGGSGTGAGALQNKLPVTLSGPTSRASCTSSVTVATPKLHRTNTGCPANLTSKSPDWGISDVEPEIFVGELAPPVSEGGAYVPGGPSLTRRNVAGLGFGFNVTLGMYRALQHVQFPNTSACDPAPLGSKSTDGNDDNGNQYAGAIAGDGISDAYQETVSDSATPPTPKAGGAHRRGDTRVCMPNLSRFKVNQILAGNVPTLAELVDSSTGQDLQASNAAFNAWRTTDPNLYVCRRRAGSGTHAQTSMFFLNTQCGPTSQVMATDAALPGQIFEAVSSGSMDRCLDALDRNVAAATDLNPPVTATGSRKYAVGYQSVEKNSDFSGSYRFIKIDGRAPTLVEQHAGNYLNFGELTMQRRTTPAYSDPGIAGGEITVVNRMFDHVAKALNEPAGVTAANAAGLFQQPFGPAGFLIDPDPFGSPARTPTATFSASNPVGTFVHQVIGGEQDSCLTPQKGFPAITPIPVDL